SARALPRLLHRVHRIRADGGREGSAGDRQRAGRGSSHGRSADRAGRAQERRAAAGRGLTQLQQASVLGIQSLPPIRHEAPPPPVLTNDTASPISQPTSGRYRPCATPSLDNTWSPAITYTPSPAVGVTCALPVTSPNAGRTAVARPNQMHGSRARMRARPHSVIPGWTCPAIT